jgi:lipid II:glycine glycyltransferase (peptidoglycan interpeptide bridge formation enzyme)
LNFTIELNDKKQEDILSGMNYNRRREIRLSLDNGAFHKVCESEDELRILYNILEELYKKKVKLPLPDYEYFRMLWQSKTGKVFVVMHQGKIIGGSICAFMDKISIYTMYYCGLRDYNKKIFPSNLAVLAAIVYAIQNGMKLLDFMGAGLKGEEYGVRKYKQEFGGTLNEYGRYRKILQPFWFKIGLKGIEMLKRQGQLFSTT